MGGAPHVTLYRMAAAKCIALLLLALAVGGTHAIYVGFWALYDKGTDRFDTDIGKPYAESQINFWSEIVWKTFAQQTPAKRKKFTSIILNQQNFTPIDSFCVKGQAIYSSPVYVDKDPADLKNEVTVISCVEGNSIYLNSDYVYKYPGDIKNEFSEFMYQAVTDIWQWDGNGTAPAWWKGGVPAYMRIAAGYAPSSWAHLGTGDSWEEGFDVTGRFIEYLDAVTPDFVAKMNAKIEWSWDIGYFKDITGKSVHELWKDYKARFRNGS
eukprot:PITA_05273